MRLKTRRALTAARSICLPAGRTYAPAPNDQPPNPGSTPRQLGQKTTLAETANFSSDGIACFSVKNRQSALSAPVLSSGATGDAYKANSGKSKD